MATYEQQQAREHYDTRQQRRPRQVWMHADGRGQAVPAKGAKGAIPTKLTNTQEETK